MRFIQQSLARQLTFGIGGMLAVVFLLMSLWQSSRIQQQIRLQLLDEQQGQLAMAAVQLQQQSRLLSLMLARPVLQGLLPEGQAAVAPYLRRLADDEPWLRQLRYRSLVSGPGRDDARQEALLLAPGELALELPARDQHRQLWGHVTAVLAPGALSGDLIALAGEQHSGALWLVSGQGRMMASLPARASAAMASSVQAEARQSLYSDGEALRIIDTPEVLGWALRMRLAAEEQPVSLLMVAPTATLSALQWREISGQLQGNLLLLACCVSILLIFCSWHLQPLQTLRGQLEQMLAQRRRGEKAAAMIVTRNDELGRLTGLVNELTRDGITEKDRANKPSFRPPLAVSAVPSAPPANGHGLRSVSLVAINSAGLDGRRRTRHLG